MIGTEKKISKWGETRQFINSKKKPKICTRKVQRYFNRLKFRPNLSKIKLEETNMKHYQLERQHTVLKYLKTGYWRRAVLRTKEAAFGSREKRTF